MGRTLDIPEAEHRLHDLRVEELGDLGLGGLAIALSLVATQLAQTIALPLFVGGVAVVILGGRAFFRRWDLCDCLLLDPTAYAIREVNALGERAASSRSRASLARAIRGLLESGGPRVELVAEELTELADELEDESLRLDPLCAVRCRRLLTDAAESPLLSSLVPGDGLRVTIRSIRAGFEPRD